MMAQWMIVVSGPDKIEDIRQASDEVLSLRRALEEVILLFVFTSRLPPNQLLDIGFTHKFDLWPKDI
jgi:hypothetical protein